MQKNKDNHSLLAILKDYYAKLAVVIVKMRMHSYHLFSKKNRKFNIRSLLANQVDELASTIAKEENCQDNSTLECEQHSDIIDNKKSFNNISDTETDFSKYLKNRRQSLFINHSLGNKLIATVWEQIHAAVRYAKQGDVNTARLHSDIAGNALEEASHYLSHEDYSDLIFQIEQYFIDSKKDKE